MELPDLSVLTPHLQIKQIDVVKAMINVLSNTDSMRVVKYSDYTPIRLETEYYGTTVIFTVEYGTVIPRRSLEMVILHEQILIRGESMLTDEDKKISTKIPLPPTFKRAWSKVEVAITFDTVITQQDYEIKMRLIDGDKWSFRNVGWDLYCKLTGETFWIKRANYLALKEGCEDNSHITQYLFNHYICRNLCLLLGDNTPDYNEIYTNNFGTFALIHPHMD